MKLLLALLLPFIAAAQQPTTYARYCSTSGDVVLNAAATTFTIQQTASSNKTLVLESANVYTSVAGSFTQTVNGTAASATAGTITQVPSNAPTITTQATSWTASNVGGGTAIGGKLYTSVGGPGFSVDLTNNGSNVILKPTSTASNYSVVVASMTGTANVTVCWHEQ